MKDFELDTQGRLKVGEGTFFANPFIVGGYVDVEWLDKFHSDDIATYIFKPHVLTRRDCFYLYVRYVVWLYMENPQALHALKTATDYVCDCNYNRWCIAKALKSVYQNKYEIPSQQISYGLLRKIERR